MTQAMHIYTAIIPNREMSVSAADPDTLIRKLVMEINLHSDGQVSLNMDKVMDKFHREGFDEVKDALSMVIGIKFIESYLDLPPLLIDMAGNSLDILIDDRDPPLPLDIVVLETAKEDDPEDHVYSVHSTAFIGSAYMRLVQPRPFRRADARALANLIRNRHGE
jgi:hypothetical protein